MLLKLNQKKQKKAPKYPVLAKEVMRQNQRSPGSPNSSDEDSPALFKPIVEKYQSLWKLFIRPHRKRYPRDALGPERRRVNMEMYYKREDKELTNRRGEKIVYTYYTLKKLQQESKGIGGFLRDIAQLATKQKREFGEAETVMIYLHSHGGCRTEGLFL